MLGWIETVYGGDWTTEGSPEPPAEPVEENKHQNEAYPIYPCDGLSYATQMRLLAHSNAWDGFGPMDWLK